MKRFGRKKVWTWFLASAWLASSSFASASPEAQPSGAAPQVKASKPKAAKPKAKSPGKKAAKASTPLPEILQKIEEKYSQAGSLVADFRQTNESKALKQKKSSQGVIMVKKPNKIRWETQEPNPNLLVSDGKKFWFYTPPFDEDERGQVIVKKSSEIQSKLANALLSGSFSSATQMKIERKSDSLFVLTPKKGTAGSVLRAELSIEPDDQVIEKVVLEHRDGNRAEIRLSKIRLGEKLGDNIFQFEIPPNTDRVD